MFRSEVIQMLLGGRPKEEILAEFPGSFKPRQLDAYAAHITMGRYKKD